MPRKTNRMPMDRPDPVPEGEKSYIWIDSQQKNNIGFCCSLCLNDGRVYYAPPIVDYMVGWDVEKIMNYCFERNWKAEWEGSSSQL